MEAEPISRDLGENRARMLAPGKGPPRSWNFQLRIAELLRNDFGADHAWCLLGRETVDRCARGWRLGSDGSSPLYLKDSPLRALALDRVFSPDVSRRAWRLDELDLQCRQEGAELEWLRDTLGADGEPGAEAIVSLDLEGHCFGLAGVGRSRRRFAAEELSILENVARIIAAGASTQLGVDDLECQVAVIRTLGQGSGIEIVVDRDSKSILWASDPEFERREHEAPDERCLADAIEQRLLASTTDEMPPTPIRMPVGVVVAAACLGEDSPFPGRCAAARIQSFGGRVDPLEELSARERSVARFLVNGYAAPNIAAITGLAEHTVRTYVRRIYRKLDVCNRADLIRKVLGGARGASS